MCVFSLVVCVCNDENITDNQFIKLQLGKYCNIVIRGQQGKSLICYLVVSNVSKQILSVCHLKMSDRDTENMPSVFYFSFYHKVWSLCIFCSIAINITFTFLSNLQMLWKSSLSSTPTAGRTPRGVARRPGAAGFLGGSAGARGRSLRRSRPARTACRTGAAASPARPWALAHRIGFLQTRRKSAR